MAAIQILGLSKTYRTEFWQKRARPALKPLFLEIREGEIFGFLGPNGAGKTTTLRLLLGLISPSSGTAKLFGKEWDDPAVRRQVGFLPEQPYFYDYLSVGELLEYFARLSGIAASQCTSSVRAALARVGWQHDSRLRLRTLSKGMLQKVGIAQAILHDPRLVLLDEPMSGLDPVGRREVRTLIEQLKAEGRTVLFSTHILADAEALCDRVGILAAGELRGVGAVAELTGSLRGTVEILWQGLRVPASVRALTADCYQSGDTVRAVVEDQDQDVALDSLRREGLRIVSITPVRVSLEDYFLERLQPTSEAVRAGA
jgi:ABC-2 type transport system ATP-binding protein